VQQLTQLPRLVFVLCQLGSKVGDLDIRLIQR
jgi:hypothetical protein